MANTEHFDLMNQGAEVWNRWYGAHPNILADFTGLRLACRDLSGLNLKAVRFNNADLRYADLSGSDLRGAVFVDATIDRANLSGANLAHAVGLSQRQIDNTIGNARTVIPDHLQRPASWGGRIESDSDQPNAPAPVRTRRCDTGSLAAIVQRIMSVPAPDCTS